MARVLRRNVLPAARWASAAARCDSCRPQLWEIAAAMLLAPTGAAGGRTWYVARALQRVARPRARCRASVGHCLVVPGTLLDAGCGRAHSAHGPHRPGRFRARPDRYHGVRGTRLHARTSDGALRDRTRP